LTAALAEATVNCTGTIGPDSFEVKNGFLVNKFTCTAEVDAAAKKNGCGQKNYNECPLERVTKLLDLQNFHTALPRFKECLTDRHDRWSKLFDRTKMVTCPTWKEPTVIGAVSKDGNHQRHLMLPNLKYVPAPETDKAGSAVYVSPIRESRLPGPEARSDDQRFVDIRVPTKTSVLYNVFYPDGVKRNCADPAVCAAQCAAFLPGFVVSAGGSQVLADPASWYREDNYGAKPCGQPGTEDPYCPQDEFVHQMSVNSTSDGITVPPGDIYGHRNRANVGEHCDRWRPGTSASPGFDYETDLVLECTDLAQTNCLSRCGN
jgi:hypothetical protein